jgi:hypothetical protein
MSTHLQSDTPSVPAKRDFPVIDRLFDTAEHIVERSEGLLSLCKAAVAPLLLFVQAHNLTAEKLELYLYRSVILSITAIHLFKFLWYSIGH